MFCLAGESMVFVCELCEMFCLAGESMVFRSFCPQERGDSMGVNGTWDERTDLV